MSIAGGLYKALERGAEAGCDVIQVFTKPNKQWAAKPLTPADVEAWWAAREATGIEPSLAHDSYLINVASPEAAGWKRSHEALAIEYRRCGVLGIPNLVMHPGAHLGTGDAAGIVRIAAALDRVLGEQPDNPTRILLENTAGQGTNLGHRFEHLRDLLGAVEAPERLGVCIDTCHTLAAGYAIETPAGWAETFAEFDRVVGLDWIQAFHVNDSKKERGSRVDRHEHLGRGHLGLSAIRCLVNEPRFVGLPMTIETPRAGDAVNLQILRALAGRSRITPTAKRLASEPLD